MNTISTHTEKDGVLPCITQFVHILLVDHDKTSLMSLASQFEKQLYKGNDLIYEYLTIFLEYYSFFIANNFVFSLF